VRLYVKKRMREVCRESLTRNDICAVIMFKESDIVAVLAALQSSEELSIQRPVNGEQCCKAGPGRYEADFFLICACER